MKSNRTNNADSVDGAYAELDAAYAAVIDSERDAAWEPFDALIKDRLQTAIDARFEDEKREWIADAIAEAEADDVDFDDLELRARELFDANYASDGYLHAELYQEAVGDLDAKIEAIAHQNAKRAAIAAVKAAKH